MKSVRQAAVAGMFYPDSPSGLRDEVQQYLSLAKIQEPLLPVQGLLAPHAGYLYSGLTAAYAYNTIQNQNIKTVVILSPSHREYFRGISVYSGGAYKTPLGEVPVNTTMRDFLTAGEKYIFSDTRGHGKEHAVEVHLPFLQMMLGDFTFVPIVMGDQHPVFIQMLAEKLKEIVSNEVLLIASSDLSHFYPRDVAEVLDSQVEKHVNDYNYQQLASDLENKRCEACGGGLLVAMMQALNSGDTKKMKSLHRTDSGQVSGDTQEVVGYLSAAIYQ